MDAGRPDGRRKRKACAERNRELKPCSACKAPKALDAYAPWMWGEPDGRRERIYANERIRSQISQHASVEARVIKEEAPPRRTNHPPRPPGTKPTLPAVGRDIGGKTLGELAHDHGYGSHNAVG